MNTELIIATTEANTHIIAAIETMTDQAVKLINTDPARRAVIIKGITQANAVIASFRAAALPPMPTDNIFTQLISAEG